MLRSKIFWRGLMASAVALYLLGMILLSIPETRLAGAALLVGLILLHLAEMKTALKIGRARQLPDTRIYLMNLVFGFTWWLPLKNGILNE